MNLYENTRQAKARHLRELTTAVAGTWAAQHKDDKQLAREIALDHYRTIRLAVKAALGPSWPSPALLDRAVQSCRRSLRMRK